MGNGTTQRQHADAIRAANMKRDGLTTRAIAVTLGLKPEQVKARVLLGERLISTQSKDTL